MNTLSWITKILVVIGAINWGLVGAFNWNLVEAIFGTGTFTDIVYILVGLSGIWELIALFKK
ncbi:MAG: DUF378 domain-containing protein [Nanoarchaeota archaeon]